MSDPSTTTTETPPPTGDPVAPAPPPLDPSEKKFTQEDVDRHAGRRAAEAKRTAAKELAETLGMTVEEATAKLAKLAEQEEAEKTEVEKAREDAAQARREATDAKAQAAQESFETKLFRKLSAAGVGAGLEAEAAEKRMAMARRLLDLTVDASDEDIAEKIAEIKTDVPGLFSVPDGKTPAPSGVTSGAAPPAGGQATTSAIERGRQRYRSARPDPDKQTDPFSSPAIRRVG
jgi:hypothetical protein